MITEFLINTNDYMTSLEFFKLVRAMRVAQKQYFKNRQVDDLRKSKALEKRVDDEIMRFSDVLKSHQIQIEMLKVEEGGCNG